MQQLRKNIQEICKTGDDGAQAVLDAIDLAKPTDDRVIFMGFCPGADLRWRQDTQWKADGICTFGFFQSEKQLTRFRGILAGDLIVLKKRQEFGRTMQLYGHGRVTGHRADANGHRELLMNWSTQNEVIEVPLMGANSTVDVKTIQNVREAMPDFFWTWLE